MRAQIENLAKRVVFGHKSTDASYIKWLRGLGVRIGDNVRFYSPWTVKIDVSRPWMITIGDNVHITADCSILTHDYSWSVIQRITGEVLGPCGEVKIGNNVFIGQKSIILKGACIGDNVVIGAGSVVSGVLEGNCVYAGVPARKICSIDRFIEKRRVLQIEEAVKLVIEYERVYGERPPKVALREFFWLFEPRDGALSENYQKVNDLCGNHDRSTTAFAATPPVFDGYEEFLLYAEGLADATNLHASVQNLALRYANSLNRTFSISSVDGGSL